MLQEIYHPNPEFAKDARIKGEKIIQDTSTLEDPSIVGQIEDLLNA